MAITGRLRLHEISVLYSQHRRHLLLHLRVPYRLPRDAPHNHSCGRIGGLFYIPVDTSPRGHFARHTRVHFEGYPRGHHGRILEDILEVILDGLCCDVILIRGVPRQEAGVIVADGLRA